MAESKENKVRKGAKAQDGSMIIEILIMIIISICIIFLIGFVNDKFEEYEGVEEAMLFIRETPEYNVDETILSQEMMNFRPNGCKLIELYTEDFQPVFRVAFTNDESLSNFDELYEYPKLTSIFESEEYGHTSFEIGDQKEDIIFEWTESTDGNRYLLIVYMVRPIVENIWVFSLICYIILILGFTLILRMILKKNSLYIQQYRLISKM